MIQFSVYGRLCNNSEDVAKHESRLMLSAPSSGSIRTLTVTEKQYAGIKIIAGKKKEREKSVKGYQMSFFWKKHIFSDFYTYVYTNIEKMPMPDFPYIVAYSKKEKVAPLNMRLFLSLHNSLLYHTERI